MQALLILSLWVALWPAAVHAQTRVAVDTVGELKAVLDLQSDPARGKQAFDDLLRGLEMIRNGGRGKSNAEMVAVVRAYAPADLRAVTDYLAQLAAPR